VKLEKTTMEMDYIVREVTATELHLKSMNKEVNPCPMNSHKHLLIPADVHDTSFSRYAETWFCSLTHYGPLTTAILRANFSFPLVLPFSYSSSTYLLTFFYLIPSSVFLYY
jgi:hypothetical protein